MRIVIERPPAYGAELKAAHRWLLLITVLLLPCLAGAATARQDALKDLQCGTAQWDECKSRVAQMDAEELYHLRERLNWRYMHQRDEIRDISAFLLRSAADKGYFRAQIDLARHYLYTKKDLVTAAQWYDIAAANQSVAAWERESAAESARALRALPGEGRRENIWFMSAAALLLVPVFLPWGVQRNNRTLEILSALPNLLNGLVYMVRGEDLKHPLLQGVLKFLPDMFLLFGVPVLCITLYGVLLWRNRGRRIYIATNAALYVITLGAVVLFLMALSGMASQGAGR